MTRSRRGPGDWWGRAVSRRRRRGTETVDRTQQRGEPVSQIQQSVDVDVPVSVAYNQWTQFESFPNFMSGVESITQIDDTHNRWVTNIAGVTREFDTEVTEQHPDERVAWT